MTTRKPSEIIYVERRVNTFRESNWHGPMTYAKVQCDGLLSNSSGTVSVRTYSEDEYARLVEMNPGRTFA